MINRIIPYLFASFLLLNGCSSNQQGQENVNTKRQQATNVNYSTIQQTDQVTDSDTAKRLIDLASKVPHVNDATAVVFGDYAIVGIDIDSDIDRSQVGTIKYSVGETLKHDPFGAKAAVVADPDLNARIKEVAKDIQNGKPVRGILNELSDITSRIIPEVPGDIQDPTPAKAIEEQKGNLNNHEKKNLDDKQEKQSNGHK
ncbi:YhcN/YlaJ family sporulation lipoprotein [Peribacillus loiseleuriae]|uniref:YhcN/YlaJ family sporulation lipoprotein n=1 Tax=Peribacillus loiseleuriae TaxID=1679170 RepID=UPI00380176AB